MENQKQKPRKRNRTLLAIGSVVVIIAFLMSAVAVFNQPAQTVTVDLTGLAVVLNVSGEIMNVTWNDHPDCFFVVDESNVKVNTSCNLIREAYELRQGDRVSATNCSTSDGVCPVEPARSPYLTPIVPKGVEDNE